MTGPLTIYTTSTCAPCVQLKKFLNYKGIPYETVIIDDNLEAMQEINDSLGYFIVPFVKIGDKRVAGYKPAEIMEAIEA